MGDNLDEELRLASDADLNRQLCETVNRLNKVIDSLVAELKELREENARLRKTETEHQQPETEYHTDEDELVMETVVDETSPGPSKKRKRVEDDVNFPPLSARNRTAPKHKKVGNSQEEAPTPTPASKQPSAAPQIILSGPVDHNVISRIARDKSLKDYTLTCSSNRSWQLDPIDQTAHDEIMSQLKIAKIYSTTTQLRIAVAGQPYTNIRAALRKVKADRFRMTTKPVNEWKINPQTEQTHATFIQELKHQNIQYHTFQAKGDKPHQVVVRGLNQDISDDEIKTWLTEEGWKCSNVYNMPWRNLDGTSQRSCTFFLTFDNSADFAAILNIKSIMGIVVRMETVNKRTQAIQCKRCQQFHHSAAYCTRSPRCVKCGEGHESRSCNKPPDTKATCANCRGDHPANYRGCPVAKQSEKQSENNSKLSENNNNKNESPVDHNTKTDGWAAAVKTTKTPDSNNVRHQRINSSLEEDTVTVAKKDMAEMGELMNAILDKLKIQDRRMECLELDIKNIKTKVSSTQ